MKVIPGIYWAALGWLFGLLIVFLPQEGKYYAIIASIMIVSFLFMKKWNIAIWIMLVSASFGMGWANLDLIQHPSKLAEIIGKDDINTQNERIGVFIGKVDSDPVIDGDRLRFFFSIRKAELEHKSTAASERIWVSIRLKSEEEQLLAKNLSRGDWLRLPLTLSPPQVPTNPGAFDFPGFLWKEYSVWVGEKEGLKGVETVKRSSFIGWRGIVGIRSAFEERLGTIYSTDIAGLMKGMLLGDRQEVSVDLEEVYQRTGILHVLAISGFHVMVIIGGLYVLFQQLRLTRERTYDILMLFMLFYMFLTGFSPSVVRAGLMGLIYLLAQRFHQGYSAWKAISLAFLIMTICVPRQIFDIGFQLSFVVTFGLIAFTKPISDRIRELQVPVSDSVRNAIALSIVAQVVSLPLLISYFHQISIPSLIVNLLVVPLFALIIPWGYLSLLLAFVSIPAATAIALPLDRLLHGLHFLLNFLSELPQSVVSIAIPSSWWYYVYVIFFLLIMWKPMNVPIPLKKDRFIKRFRMMGITLLGIALLLPFFLNSIKNEVSVTFIDVGQGDSILIQGPGTRSILIDGGGIGFYIPKEPWQMQRDPFDVGKDIVVPALRALGVSKLDWVVATHGDGDHIGGLKEVIKQIPVKRVLVNGMPPSSSLEEELMRLIDQKNIVVYQALTGTWLKFRDQVYWSILSGGKSFTAGRDGDNNASVVLLLSAYGRKFLFTGDLEKEGESELISRFENLDVDVLKVGHHGSKTSTSEPFLKKIDPEFAVISVGKDNRYGHPAKEVLQRLEEHNVRYFRTDTLGAITITIHPDGRLTWKHWRKE